MERKLLPWNPHYPEHLPTPTIPQSPYSSAQTVSPCVKLSSHPILEHSQFTVPSTPSRLPSLFNGSLAILSFQVMISQTRQSKKQQPLPQTQFYLFLCLVPFKSLTIRFVRLHQHKNGSLLCTVIERFPEIQNK